MEIYFEVLTKLDVIINITKDYWNYIVEIKHKTIKGKESIIKETLTDPDQIRKSKIDKDVFPYYKKFDKLYCVVAKHKNNKGFIITCYPTDRIKEGKLIWKK